MFFNGFDKLTFREEKNMVICKGLECSNKHCCIECPNKYKHCICEIAEELYYDKELILQKCEYAEEKL